VVALCDEERAAMAALPFDDEAYRAEIPVTELVGETGYTTLERKGSRPTLDVNGIWGGFQGEGSKTIIPAHAHAKVSCRLVADQDPEKVYRLLRDHVAEIAPPGVTVTTTYHHGGSPSLTPTDHPATQAAARAIEAVYGVQPVYIREGGSIPVTAAFDHVLGLPVVLLGFAQPTSNAHAPNEWFLHENFEGGTRVIVRLWDELGALERQA
jgi:acetylornithine deacetylase/succinyl-diaminopimelate desuccinylase-like protein